MHVHISDLNAEEKMLQFKVTDTGIGLSPDKQQNIFAAFAQTDNATEHQLTSIQDTLIVLILF